MCAFDRVLQVGAAVPGVAPVAAGGARDFPGARGDGRDRLQRGACAHLRCAAAAP